MSWSRWPEKCTRHTIIKGCIHKENISVLAERIKGKKYAPDKVFQQKRSNSWKQSNISLRSNSMLVDSGVVIMVLLLISWRNWQIFSQTERWLMHLRFQNWSNLCSSSWELTIQVLEAKRTAEPPTRNWNHSGTRTNCKSVITSRASLILRFKQT